MSKYLSDNNRGTEMDAEKVRQSHTPGPWGTRRSKSQRPGERDIAIIALEQMCSDGHPAILAECFENIRDGLERNLGECEANARLIAAAPDLLDVVHCLLIAREHETGNTICDENSPLIDAARAAMAKVKGQLRG